MLPENADVFSVPKSLDKRVDKGKQSLECGFFPSQVMLGSGCECGGFFWGVCVELFCACESLGCVCVVFFVNGSLCVWVWNFLGGCVEHFSVCACLSGSLSVCVVVCVSGESFLGGVESFWGCVKSVYVSVNHSESLCVCEFFSL